VVLADKGSQGANLELKVGDELGIEVQESNKGVQRLASCRKGPMADRIILGRGRAVAIWPKVKANPFNAVEEEVTLLGVEGESPFGEDMADTLKVEQ
jgi:hypothetical protein